VIVLDNEIKDMLVKLLEDVAEIKTEVKKNSMELETIGKNINIVVEVQTAHKEQHDFSFKNTDALIDEKTDLLGVAVKSVSKDVKEVKESVDVMKDVIGRHQIDIEILKRRPV
jgi:archaellum component FlaC